MTITGTDAISLKILEAFEQGIKIKDVPSKFSVSLDQVKRLSHYRKMKNFRTPIYRRP